MAVNNTRRLARKLAGADTHTRIPATVRRKGVVAGVNADGTVTVTIGGDATPVPNVATMANYMPKAGDTVWIDVTGTDMVVTDRQGSSPSVFGGVAVASVSTTETLSASATSYGDLATSGPSVSVTVGDSGLLLVTVSAKIRCLSATDGGAMGFDVSGTATSAASDGRSLYWDPTDNDATMAASRVSLLSALTPGANTVTARYRGLRSGGSGMEFSNRVLWALPL